MDLFGNPIDCSVNSDGDVNGYVGTFMTLENVSSFYFVVKTAKGSYFPIKISWYSENDSELPLSHLHKLILNN